MRIKQQVAVFHTVHTGELLHLLKRFYFMVSKKKQNKTNYTRDFYLFIYSTVLYQAFWSSYITLFVGAT